MPAWHNRLGAVVPGTALHYLDGYGEQRAVLATFSYDETPHTLVAVTSPWPVSRVLAVQLLRSSDDELRQRILASVLDSWQLPPDHEQQWSDALHQISSRLWSLEPDELSTAVANYLLSEGTDGLLLSDLTELAIEHAADARAFMDAAIARVTVDPDDLDDLDGEWADEPDDD